MGPAGGLANTAASPTCDKGETNRIPMVLRCRKSPIVSGLANGMKFAVLLVLVNDNAPVCNCLTLYRVYVIRAADVVVYQP
jgi:hypothetical protein